MIKNPKLFRKMLSDGIRDGYIIEHKHPTLDLYLYNYTRKCSFDKAWNETTLLCRGLILDGEGNIVSLPLPKFFNWGELTTEQQKKYEKMSFTATEKLDGSCGIAWKHNGQYGIATRGSFSSEQAIWATNLLNTKYKNLLPYIRFENVTLVFEIIYPKNRVVVNYGDFADIVLIAVMNNETGEDISFEDIVADDVLNIFERVTHYPNLEHLDFEDIQKQNATNREGYVIRFENGDRVKLKFDEYCRLHSKITNFCSRDIWTALKADDESMLVEILENVPDEFDKWVRYKIHQFREDFQALYDTAVKAWENVLQALPEEVRHNKKVFAKENQLRNKYTNLEGLVFALEAGKDISAKIWDRLYPPHEKPFNNTEEDN